MAATNLLSGPSLAKQRPDLTLPWAQRLHGWRYLSMVLLLALGYRTLVVLVFKLPLSPDLPAYPFWPPIAYAQLVVVLLGLRFWPAVTLGSLLNTVWSDGQSLWPEGLFAAANNTAQVFLGVWLLSRFRFDRQLSRLRDVRLLIVLGAMVPSAVSATVGVVNCCLVDAVSLVHLGSIWFNWWIGNVTSILIFFPVALLLPACWQQIQARQRLWEGGAWAVLLAGLAWYVFVAPDRYVVAHYLLMYLPFPLAIWGAIRLGRAGAGVAISLTTSLACWGFIMGCGPFLHFSVTRGENATMVSPEQAILALQAYLCILIGVTLALAAGVTEQDAIKADLADEKEKSEQLLLNILPQPIAQRLKQDQKATIADQFAEVTVLFADIVDFTKLSAELPPRDLVVLLNDIFSAFDDLADHYGLEKIKTIGDAYMVVGGLPDRRDDHALAIVAMAQAMRSVLQEVSQQYGRTFQMRIGINTGPVVAGVIGTKKFIYDLWGDTVNIASRMESAGLANEIQITAATHQALQGCYDVESRQVQVKGKGWMTTYLLRQSRLAATR
ncbi:MAG: adenylate/guanylate cyclase domain-containing protein [Leptolyngbyaceae cyanobacterium]